MSSASGDVGGWAGNVTGDSTTAVGPADRRQNNSASDSRAAGTDCDDPRTAMDLSAVAYESHRDDRLDAAAKHFRRRPSKRVRRVTQKKRRHEKVARALDGLCRSLRVRVAQKNFRFAHRRFDSVPRLQAELTLRGRILASPSAARRRNKRTADGNKRARHLNPSKCHRNIFTCNCTAFGAISSLLTRS